jgi:type II secretory pathway pseudopilin PulG
MRNQEANWKKRRLQSAFTLTEVVMAMAISALVIGGIIAGYTMSSQRAEWSSYSLAAHSLAMQRLEQTRACKWDPQGWPQVDELVSTNFPVRVDVLDLPISGTNVVYATNTTTITTITTNPPLKMIRVDCKWMFLSRGPFTNTVATYRTADQ